MLLKQSTARNLMVLMVSSTDHITGVAGATLTITASKDGAAFASISPTVTDRGNGWYSLALTAAHTDTLGDLALRITAAGCDPTDLTRQVVVELPGELTTAAISDRVLGRALAGGADGGRTVRDALRTLRNRQQIAAGTLTIYQEDDTTAAWTAAVTSAPGDPLVSLDPA